MSARARVVAVSAAMAVAYLLVAGEGPRGHSDHYSYLRTVRYMQGGEGYYEAMRRAFGDLGTTIGHARAYRPPTPFLLWRWIPEDLLYVSFLLVVVVGTTWALTRMTTHPWAVLPVTAYLLLAGRRLDHDVTEAWLLVELWTLPFLAGGVAAWEQRRDRLSAGLFLAAALLREITVPMLGAGLVAAQLRGRDRRPWLVSLLVFAVAFAVHLTIAGRLIEPPGNDAVLWGTGAPPLTVLEMATYLLPGPMALWLPLWGLAVVQARRRGLLLLLLPLLALPVLGLAVDRGYWGLTMVPFALLLAGELVAEAVADVVSDVRRRGARAAGSSPPPGTPVPGPGSPVAVPAPPSG